MPNKKETALLWYTQGLLKPSMYALELRKKKEGSYPI